VALDVGVSVGFQNPAPWRAPWPSVYEGTIAFVRAAEALGLDHVWLTEHHFADDGYLPSPMPAAAALGRETTRMRIGTKVLLLPFYDPLRLAEDIAVADNFAGGRLDVGLAAGYSAREFDGYGRRRGERSARLGEGLEILARALAGERVQHAGRFYAYGDVRVTPPLVQQPVPLWLGGRSVAAMRRAARFGAHLALAGFDPDEGEADCEAYFAAWQAAGRDPSVAQIVAGAVVFVDEDPERAWALAGPHLLHQQQQYEAWLRSSGDRPTRNAGVQLTLDALRAQGHLVGTPADVAARLATFRARVPITHLGMWMLLPGMPVELAVGSLELFARSVLPGLRGAGSAMRDAYA
jgi:alkanesulfonate monooxygenase SsuD/methylene tetrahydromethanopterin reductase-like flavin-dependent oxidoreductase (luciferase family)